MNGLRLDPEEARLIVEARLGRKPQDMLEAAVVLEAWAGMPAQGALAAASALMPPQSASPQASVGRVPPPRSQEGVVFEGTAFIITVLAIAFWAAPLTSSLGVAVVERGLLVALPLALALQWALRSRYLDRPHGLLQLGAQRSWLLLGACLVVAVPWALFGVSGMLAGLLTVTLTSGTILVRRRWPAVYAAIILVATPVMLAGVPVQVTLAAVAAVAACAVALALSPSETPARRSPGRWARVLTAGAIGASLGAMLVLDETVSWTAGAVPALALLPSTVASFWGGYHLRHLEQAIPRAVSGVSATQARPRGRAWPPLAVLAGAIGRLLGLSAALSAAMLAFTPLLGASARGAGVLVGFALLALATLLVSLLESMGRGPWALVATACAAAAEATVRLNGSDPFAGIGLVVGGGLAVVMVLPPVIALLSRPANTLATALWIP